MKRKQTELQALGERVKVLEELLRDCSTYLIPSSQYDYGSVEQHDRSKLLGFPKTFRKEIAHDRRLRESIEILREHAKIPYCVLWGHDATSCEHIGAKCSRCGMAKRWVWEQPEPSGGAIGPQNVMDADVTKVTSPPTDS